MKDAKFYKITGQWGNEAEYVEAESFGQAIKKWLKYVNSAAYQGEDDDFLSRAKIKEPQTVELVTLRGVLR